MMTALCLMLTIAGVSSGDPVPVPLGGDLTPTPTKAEPVAEDAALPAAPAESIEAVVAAPEKAPEKKETRSPDVQILALVLELLDPDSPATRGEAAKKIAGLEDERVINALAYVARFDSDRSVALLAVEALGAQPSERAVKTLETFASSTTSRLRRASIEALAKRTDAATGEALYRLATERSSPRSTRVTARAALEANHGELLATRPPVETIEPSQSTGIDRPELSIISGVLFGSYNLATLGTIGKSGAGPVIGMLGGAVAGGAAGWLFRGRMPANQLAFGSSAMLWGTVTGLAGTYALVRDPSIDAALAWGVAGQAVGFGLAYATAEGIDFSVGDTAFANAAGLVGGMMGIGALQFAKPTNDSRRGVAVVLGSSLTGLALGTGFGQWIELTPGDATMVGLLGYQGWQTGNWFAELIVQRRLDFDENLGAEILATGTGFIAGTLMAQWTDFRTTDALHALLFSAYGSSLSSGLAVFYDAGRNARLPLQLALTWGGFASALTWARPLEYSSGDAALISVATSIGFWHGVAIGGYLAETDRLDGGRATGLMGILPPVFGIAAIAVSQYTEPEVYETLMGSSGSIWGAWFALAGAILIKAEFAPGLLAVLIASDIGLAATTGLVSPLIGMNANVVAGINVGGLAGALTVTLVAALFTRDSNSLITASLVGSGAGFLAGGLTMHLLRDESPSIEGDSAVAELFGNWRLAQAGPQPVIGPSGQIEGAVFSVAFVN